MNFYPPTDLTESTDLTDLSVGTPSWRQPSVYSVSSVGLEHYPWDVKIFPQIFTDSTDLSAGYPSWRKPFRVFREFCGRLDHYPWDVKIFPQISQISQIFQWNPIMAQALCVFREFCGR